MVQADKEFRDDISKLRTIYVRDKDSNMVPLSTLVTHKEILGPQVIEHYNLYRSAKVSGAAAPGFSSGQAIKAMERVAKDTLPSGYGYEWTSMAYQEILAGNQISIIFTLALIFIYLFLVAQYESWLIPLAVMGSVPIALFGALFTLWVLKLENNIYTQVGFVLLFGLATKTAILIVEFAKERHDVQGDSTIVAAEAAAKLRFRPVLMTALSFVLGVIPLLIATGAGAASRRSLGSAVFGGMLFSAIFATILVPAFYVIAQKIIEYKK
jgi:HAE1 family hydrophobic/amphiphilic exporter-1